MTSAPGRWTRSLDTHTHARARASAKLRTPNNETQTNFTVSFMFQIILRKNFNHLPKSNESYKGYYSVNNKFCGILWTWSRYTLLAGESRNRGSISSSFERFPSSPRLSAPLLRNAGRHRLSACKCVLWKVCLLRCFIYVHKFIAVLPIRGLRQSLTSVDKKNQLDVTFCILYFSSNSCSTRFGQPCAHHQELTTAWCYSLVLVCAVAAGRWSSPVGR